VQLGIGGAGAEVTDWFQQQLLAALSDPLFNVPKAFETWMVDRVAVAGLNVSAGQIIGFKTDAVRIFKKAPGTQTVVSSAVETDVIAEEIPAGSMGADGGIRVTLIGDYKNSTGGAHTFTVRFKLGGTTVVTASVGGIASDAARYSASYEALIANQGATDSQMVTVNYPSFSGAAQTSWLQRVPGTAAVDTTAQQTLTVSVQHDAADANLDFRRAYYMIEFL
jgi:hypothetical protein